MGHTMGEPWELVSWHIMAHITDWVIYLACTSFSRTSEKLCTGPGPPKPTHAPWIRRGGGQGIDANMGAGCMRGLNNPFPAPQLREEALWKNMANKIHEVPAVTTMYCLHGPVCLGCWPPFNDSYPTYVDRRNRFISMMQCLQNQTQFLDSLDFFSQFYNTSIYI